MFFHLLLILRRIMPNIFKFRIINFLLITLFALSSCKTIENLPGGDARKNPPNPKLRVKKILRREEVLD